MERESADITGLWRFQPDPYEEGEAAGYADPAHDVRRWREVMVPCTFDRCLPGLASYEGAGWFRRSVDVPKDWGGRRMVLRFGAVNYHARVYVNGAPVGANDDPFLPFEIEVAGGVRCGEPNAIVVRVDNVRRPGEVPGMERGWRPFGGIFRRVELIATDPLHLAGVRVVAEPAEGGGRLELRARVRNGRARARTVRVVATVCDPDGVRLAQVSSPAERVGAGAEAEPAVETAVPGARPWSPGSPALHAVRVELLAGDARVDCTDLRAGFRRIEARPDGLLLNGERVYLTGFNRHEDSPAAGPCADLDQARRDLSDMKRMGCNFVRLCHYPHDAGELDLCDEIGLLAMAEIPLYWWNGLEEGPEACARKLGAARRQLTHMIERDANHPSVVFWSVSNETHEQRSEVADGNAELVRLVRELDPTRLAVHVSDHWQRGQGDFREDDVICLNAYPAWGHAMEGRSDADLRTYGDWWRDNLRGVHRAHPDRPILVTEFGRGAFEGVFGNAVGDDAQARLIEAEFGAMREPYVCGGTIWCYADHPWPEEDFIRRVTTSPFGVVTRERRRRAAHETVRRLFRGAQGLPAQDAPEPTPPPDNVPVCMVREHMRDLPDVPFPDGFSIRPMRDGDGAVWTDIQRDAEPFFPIGDELFTREFGSDLPATTWRSFFVVTDRNVAVATISAWYNRDFRGRDAGRVHWVAVRPAFQRRGLARAALSHVMRLLAQWHDCCMLDTSTGRLGALRLYLDFGFLPAELDDPDKRRAWALVQQKLRHPALAALGL